MGKCCHVTMTSPHNLVKFVAPTLLRYVCDQRRQILFISLSQTRPIKKVSDKRGTVAGACQSSRMRPQLCWMYTIWVVWRQLQQVASDRFNVVPQMQWLPIRGKTCVGRRDAEDGQRLDLLKARRCESERSWVRIPVLATFFTSKSPLKTTCKSSCFENLYIVYV